MLVDTADSAEGMALDAAVQADVTEAPGVTDVMMSPCTPGASNSAASS